MSYAEAIWKFLFDCSKSANEKLVLQWCHEVGSAFTNEIKASRFKNAVQRPLNNKVTFRVYSHQPFLIVFFARRNLKSKERFGSKMESIGLTKRVNAVRFFNYTGLRAAGRDAKGYSPRGKCIRY